MDAWLENPTGGETAPPDEPRFPPGPSPARGPRSSRGITWAAWAVIVILIGVKLALPMAASSDETTGGDDPVGELLMGIQGRYLVGAADILQSGPLLYLQSGQFNVGSMAQRLRFVVLAAELSGPVEARAKLDLLRQDIEEATQKAEAGEILFDLSEEDAAILPMLDVLYPPVEAGAEAAVDAGVLGNDDRDLFVARMGWFGELALTPGGASDAGARGGPRCRSGRGPAHLRPRHRRVRDGRRRGCRGIRRPRCPHDHDRAPQGAERHRAGSFAPRNLR